MIWGFTVLLFVVSLCSSYITWAYATGRWIERGFNGNLHTAIMLSIIGWLLFGTYLWHALK